MRLGREWLAALALVAFACGGSSSGPAVAPSPSGASGELWVSLQASSKMLVLRGNPLHPDIATIDLPAGAGPHITTFSPDGRYAYVSGMGNGDVEIINADSRQIVSSVHLGPAGTHQIKPAPDGSVLLAAQVPTQTLVKLTADEAHKTWSVAGSLSFAPIGRAPVCSVFRDDGKRAYVSLNPTGLAIVDVDGMKVIDTLPVAGFIACGMVKAPDGKSVMIASSGGGGHIYRLDTRTDALVDLGALGASDWHSFNMTADQKLGVGSVPSADEVRLIDLARNPVVNLTTISVNLTPGNGNDQPDAIGIRGEMAWVSLRQSGKLAVIDLARRAVLAYLDLAPAADSVNPANCAGCAIHGVTVRS